MQNRDRYTSVADFLDDESFKRWILLNDDSDSWEVWTLDKPHRGKMVDEARLWLLALRVPTEKVAIQEIQEQLKNTWLKVEQKKLQKTVQFYKAVWFQAAASVVLLLSVLGALYLYQKNHAIQAQAFEKQEKKLDSIVTVNASDHPQLVMLSDGSSVLLQPKSKLVYPSHFSKNERKVYLSGDAFFEISKNKNRPFYVYANELITKVVGTSFRIKAFSDEKNVEVVVRTGKVNVSTQNSEVKELELLPNEGARLSRKNLKFQKIEDLTQEKILTQELSNIEKLSFEFSDVPVLQIFKTIEQAYAVEIAYPKDKLENCYLTTSLSDQPLAEKLKIVCASLGTNTTYKIFNNQITINTNGCN